MRQPRKELAFAVLAGAAAAGLTLYAAARHWEVDTVTQPSPLPPKTISHSGTAIAPWLTAAGWVALAGAGALLATRRISRTLVGVVIAVAGAAAFIGALRGLTSDRWWWPVLTLLTGALIAGIGVLAANRGSDWPAMGARYERETDQATHPRPTTPADVWAALDRGEDPTTRA